MRNSIMSLAALKVYILKLVKKTQNFCNLPLGKRGIASSLGLRVCGLQCRLCSYSSISQVSSRSQAPCQGTPHHALISFRGGN
jgi:hypothetical protein